jgi:MFS family permease
MLVMGLSYFLFPFANSVGELTLYRIIYAIGMGAATGMLGTVTADYPQNRTRGKMIAVTGILNATGVIVVSIVFAKLPQTFAEMGYDQVTAGTYALWVVAGMCSITAVVVALGLQKGTPTQEQKRIPYIQQIKEGLAEGHNPRILLAYASAFVARSDLVILGTFLVLWGIETGTDMGMETTEATAKARIVFAIASMSSLIASPFIGWIIDRVNRILAIVGVYDFGSVGICLCFLLTMFCHQKRGLSLCC